MSRLSIASTALAVSVLFVPLDAAQARIVCDGNFQVVHGQPLATPYCQDAEPCQRRPQLRHAVSFDHAHPPERQCQSADVPHLGHDNRVREACLPFRDDGGPAAAGI